MNRLFQNSGQGLFSGPVQAVAILIALLLISLPAQSADTKISNRETLETGKIPKPANIWVYDFAATPGDVPADSALAIHTKDTQPPQTAEEIAKGKEVGAELAKELSEMIKAMGLSAQQATTESKPQINDLVIRGYIVSFNEGSAEKRISIGFGKGASDLVTAVEGFAVTDKGLRKLGGGSLDAQGSKAPGAALGVVGILAMHNPLGLIVSAAVKKHDETTGSSKVEGRAKQTAQEIADQLKIKFQEQGWIK